MTIRLIICVNKKPKSKKIEKEDFMGILPKSLLNINFITYVGIQKNGDPFFGSPFFVLLQEDKV